LSGLDTRGEEAPQQILVLLRGRLEPRSLALEVSVRAVQQLSTGFFGPRYDSRDLRVAAVRTR
jgi:hypothetical protein